ncbi:MAG: hypothetical protein M0P77_03955 [Firmicutes bacterium]|nr:hypothetical protein [Bacillota bacterium]
MSIGLQYRYKDEIYVVQTAKRPIVYLDNWAINGFIKDTCLGEQFIKIIENNGGTVAFSLLNLYEIVVRDDEKEKYEIMQFISRLNDAFIEMNPYKVEKRESLFGLDPIKCFENQTWAHQELIEALALYARPFKALNVAEALGILNHEIKRGYSIEKERFEEELMPIIKEYRDSKEKRKEAKRIIKNKIMLKEKDGLYTKGLVQYAFSYIVSNENMKMGNKEWFDLFHLLVPMSYCDFVLADRRWVHFSKTTGLCYPNIAKIYGPNNIGDFMISLKVYNSCGK